jgi:hypothetical protein
MTRRNRFTKQNHCCDVNPRRLSTDCFKVLDAEISQRSSTAMCAALLENKLVAGQDSEQHASIKGFSARVSWRMPVRSDDNGW